MRTLAPTLLPALTLALGACRPVPLTHVESFGESANTLAESSTVAFSLMNAAGAEQAAQALIVFPPQDETEAGKRWDALDKAVNTGLIPPAGLSERQELLGQLGSYGSALGALAGADLAAELEEKSAALFAIIITLNERVADLAGVSSPLGESAILGVQQAISTVGGALLEGKRRKSLSDLIVKSDPVVQAAATLLAKDLSPDGQLAKATHEMLTNRISMLQFYYNSQASKPDWDLEERAALIDRVRELYTERDQVDDLYASASAAAAAMGAAHTALVAATQDKSMSSTEFVAALGDFTKYVAKLDSIRERLSAANAD